jgi:signal transduction histidine kinase
MMVLPTLLTVRGWLLAVGMLLCLSCWADEAPQRLSVWIDPEGQSTLADVVARPDRFRLLPADHSGGYTRAVVWFRFEVAGAAERWLEVQPPFLDDVRVYVPTFAGSSQHREYQTGDRQPFSARPIPYRSFVIPLSWPDEATHVVYLRLQTTSASAAHLRLWTPDEFRAAVGAETLFFGLYFGVSISTLLINLTYWLWFRTPLYGWFLTYLAANLFLVVGHTGYAAQYLLPAHPRLTDAWVGLGVLLAIAAGGGFFRTLLNLDQTAPRLVPLFRFTVAAALVGTLSLVSGHFSQTMRWIMVLVMVASCAGVVQAARIWRHEQVGGGAVFLATGITLAGSVIMSLAALGILPGSVWLIRNLQYGPLGGILILHLAVMAFIRATEQRQREVLARAHEAEAQAERERQERLEQVQFLAMLSHELKTPLAMIDGAVQALGHLSEPANEDVRRRHRRIRQGVVRINNLVEKFFQQDRLDHAGPAVVRETVPLDALVADALAVSSVPDGRVQVDLPSPALSVWGDPLLLQVLLSNLIDNALKYGPADCPVRVSAATDPGASTVTLRVQDQGPGIAPALRPHLFKRYVRGEDLGDIPGAGLGLYLVRRIAEQHGGTVALEPGERGACFRVELPLAP